MNTKRIEEIQKETAYPDSISVQKALLKVWDECKAEKSVLPIFHNRTINEYNKLVENMCMSYRHDFGLMAEQDKQALRLECIEWIHAYENNIQYDT